MNDLKNSGTIQLRNNVFTIERSVEIFPFPALDSEDNQDIFFPFIILLNKEKYRCIKI